MVVDNAFGGNRGDDTFNNFGGLLEDHLQVLIT